MPRGREWGQLKSVPHLQPINQPHDTQPLPSPPPPSVGGAGNEIYGDVFTALPSRDVIWYTTRLAAGLAVTALMLLR